MKTKWMYAVLAILLLGSQLTLSAQTKTDREKKQPPTPEQVVKMQTERMVQTLMLDDATTAKFTPVYGDYLKELRECRLMTRKPDAEKADVRAKKKERAAMTDDEVAAMLRNRFAQDRKMLDIREKYYDKFSKILTQKQILKIYQQEKTNANKFRKEFDRRKKGQKPEQGRRQEDRLR